MTRERAVIGLRAANTISYCYVSRLQYDPGGQDDVVLALHSWGGSGDAARALVSYEGLHVLNAERMQRACGFAHCCAWLMRAQPQDCADEEQLLTQARLVDARIAALYEGGRWRAWLLPAPDERAGVSEAAAALETAHARITRAVAAFEASPRLQRKAGRRLRQEAREELLAASDEIRGAFTRAGSIADRWLQFRAVTEPVVQAHTAGGKGISLTAATELAQAAAGTVARERDVLIRELGRIDQAAAGRPVWSWTAPD